LPKIRGSRFRVQARPGATGCVYEIAFTFYGIGFSSPHLDMQVWARGSKVTSEENYGSNRMIPESCMKIDEKFE